jgi:hypothetical protein
MIRRVIVLFIFINILPAKSQEQIEKIFDPAEQDWMGKTLGQLGYAYEGAVKIGDEMFFIAYNELTKSDIWKTDLEKTELFIDLDTSSVPILRSAFGDWLIYSDMQDESICNFKAVNIKTKQKLDLIYGADCANERFSNFFIDGNYLAVVVNNEVLYQDLSLLPTVTIKRRVVNTEGVIIVGNIGKNKIILKDQTNPFGFAPFYILDISSGKLTQLNSLVGKPIHDATNFVEYNDKYYFQITTEPYVERLLMSCDTAFTTGSIKNHKNILSNLLFIDHDKAFFSDLEGESNTLGIYDMNTFSKIESLETGLNTGYGIWSEATKIAADKYIISGGGSSIFHYDLAENKLTSLMIDTIIQDYAMPWLTIDSGIVIRYRDNQPTERLFYFPYSDLKPREFFIQKIARPYETRIFFALPNNQLFALVYDPKTSSEYAVIDVLKDNYKILKDIHTANIGNAMQCNITYVLPDHQILIAVQSEFGNVGFIFNPITKESVPLLDSLGNFLILQLDGIYSNTYLFTNTSLYGNTEYSQRGKFANDDSVVYFMGNLLNQNGLKLFAYNFRKNQLKSVNGMLWSDKIFKVGSEVYIIRNTDEAGNLKNREILHLENNQLVSIYEADQLDDCYDVEDIHQYFIHNKILYFTSLGKLLSLNSRNNEINLLVDNLIKNSEGCYTDGIIFGNFLVKDDQVYFTESRAYMLYYYVFFLGFTWEIEQHFWRTDGTIKGTKDLAKMEPELDNELPSNISYLFIDNDEIYMFSNQVSYSGRRLYRWENNVWQVLEVKVDDTLKSVVPYFYHNETMSLNSKPGNHQRVEAHWNDLSYMRTSSSLINDTIYKAIIYSFKGAKVPELKKQGEYVNDIVNSRLTSRSAFATTQIGDKWYFPFSIGNNINYTYYPEIIQQNLSNNRQRNIINDNSMLRSYDQYIVKDEELETGYFLMQEPTSYKMNVYRLNSCPLLDEPVEIMQISNKICKSESLKIQLKGLSSLNWISIKIDGIETNYTWEKISTDNTFLIKLDIEEGKYIIDYFLDTGCGIDSLVSSTLDVDGIKPVFTIDIEAQMSDSIFSYTCSDETLGGYSWFANGGNITSGQGTSSVIVDWGQNKEGIISLVANNGSCISDTISAKYNNITSVKDMESLSFKIIPNPSTGNIIIELPENWYNSTYQLLSIDGRVMDSGEVYQRQSTLDLQKISSGIYLMMIKNKNNIITQRLVLTD